MDETSGGSRVSFRAFGHDRLNSLIGPDVVCRLVGADGIAYDEMLPAAIAHALWALPEVCGVEIFSLTIHHGDFIDDWGQSV